MQHIDHLLVKLLKDLKQLHQVRETQRKQRVKRNIPLIALVGYTNAGKSTILNTLTKSNVKAEDKLFATLDTTTRELYIDHKKVGLLSDTVGFIQNLPHQLIEAFKSTLDELHYANLLLHVVDISNPDWQQHIEVVHDVLAEVGVDKASMVHVFNKADRLPEAVLKSFALDSYAPYVIIDARTREDAEPLIRYLAEYGEKNV